MKFYTFGGLEEQQNDLKTEYETARKIGNLGLGECHLFYRKFRKVYSIDYSEVQRCFRRVMMVPMKMCCGKGNMTVETLVVCTEKGEAAQIPIPDSRAARAIMEELGKRAPGILLGAEKKQEKEVSQE